MKDFTLTGWLHEPRADAGLHFLEDDDTWRHVTYEDLAGRVAALAEVFREQGLAGQRLGLVGETSEDFAAQVFATLATGGTCVPIPFYQSGQDRAAHDRLVAAALETARPVRVVTTDGSERFADWPATSVPAYADLSPSAHAVISESELPAFVQFTSGSTGGPKGVRHGRRRLEGGLGAFRDWLELTPSDRWAGWAPLWMIGGLVWPVATQCDFVLMTSLQFSQRPDRWLRCMGEHGCTITASASFGYHHVATTVPRETLAGCRFDDWRMAMIFGEPVRVADLDEFVDAFGALGFRRRAFSQVYGMTEVTTMIAATPIDEEPVPMAEIARATPLGAGAVMASAMHSTDPGSRMVGVGRPLHSEAVEVRLPDGSRAPDGVLGEVWLSGAILAEGYEGGDDFGSWLATGDVGCLRNGELFLFGRLVDSFNIRGQIVTAPSAERRVQDALPEAGSLVVLPSRASGAGITVVLESGQPWPPEVTDRARQTVSELFDHTEVDLLIVPSGAIPRTDNGKPRRREAWARYVLGRT